MAGEPPPSPGTSDLKAMGVLETCNDDVHSVNTSVPVLLHRCHAAGRAVLLQESGLAPVLEDPSAALTVLAPANAGLAIEQLGDLQEVCHVPSSPPSQFPLAWLSEATCSCSVRCSVHRFHVPTTLVPAPVSICFSQHLDNSLSQLGVRRWLPFTLTKHLCLSRGLLFQSGAWLRQPSDEMSQLPATVFGKAAGIRATCKVRKAGTPMATV